MKRTMIAALLLTTALTGCGDSDEVTETPSTTETTPVADSVPAGEPTVIECLAGTPGPARWSDGSVSHSDWCFNQMGGANYVEEVNPAEDPQDAAVAGYGTAPNGTRNPSSGELQTQWGCRQGYIDDPALCDAVEEVIHSADPEGEIYQ